MLDLAVAVHRPNRRPAERGRRNTGDDLPPRPGQDAHLPGLTFGRRRGNRDLPLQRLGVEPERILLVVDVEGQARPALGLVQRVAVPALAVELPSVEPAAQELRHPLGRDLLVVQERLVPLELLGCRDGSVGELEPHLVPVVGHLQVELDEPGAPVRRRVQDGDGAARHLLRDALGRLFRQAVGDLLGFRVPHEHLRRDPVGRAAADRVVRGVLEDPAPGQVEEPFRPGADQRACNGSA